MWPNEAPWTAIGSLQNDITQLRSELSRKAESYSVNEVASHLANLEHSAREVGSLLDELRNRVAQLEETVRQIMPGLN